MTGSTALDANILSALLRSEANALSIARQLSALAREGSLVVSPVVYAELLAGPGVTPDFLKGFLQEVDVQLLPPPGLAVWESAGLAYGSYAQRRQRSGGGSPRRILSVFVIGAHALYHGAALFTADPQHYRLSFPALTVLTP